MRLTIVISFIIYICEIYLQLSRAIDSVHDEYVCSIYLKKTKPITGLQKFLSPFPMKICSSFGADFSSCIFQLFARFFLFVIFLFTISLLPIWYHGMESHLTKFYVCNVQKRNNHAMRFGSFTFIFIFRRECTISQFCMFLFSFVYLRELPWTNLIKVSNFS